MASEPPRYVHVLTPGDLDGESSMCGFAFDAFDSEGDHRAAGTFQHPRPGLRVTCPVCVRVIRAYREASRGLVLRPLAEVHEDGSPVDD